MDEAQTDLGGDHIGVEVHPRTGLPAYFVRLHDGAFAMSEPQPNEIYPVFPFGKGLIAIHPGQYEGAHAIILGRRGAAGMSLLEDAPNARFLRPEDTLAVLTFAKAEAVDILIESLRMVKLRMLGIHMPGGNA